MSTPPLADWQVPPEHQAEDLRTQISWFNRLRLLAVAGVAVATFVADQALGWLERAWPLYLLCGFTLLVDLGYIAWFPRLAAAAPRALRRHVHLQIGLDLLVLTLLLQQTGGVGNPCVLFYLFHAFIAALVLSRRAAFVVAGVVLLCVAGLGLGQLEGVVPVAATHLAWVDIGRIGRAGFAVWFGVFALTVGVSVYFVDTIVTKLREREDELRRLARQLGQSEKLASIGTLAAGVSHEINNPVAVIQSKVQILRYRIADGDPGDVLLKELEVIEKHTQRIAQITKGLLTFSKEAPLAFVPLAVNPLVEEAIDLVRVPFQQAGQGVEAELDATDPRIQGSANHLLQVFVNILLNARDASPSGSVLRVRTRAGEGRVTVTFADQGAGIAPENLAKIFDPFFTTKDVDKGTGLGLAITHGIVQNHRGTIEVESDVGRGTTFHVHLPRLLADS